MDCDPETHKGEFPIEIDPLYLKSLQKGSRSENDVLLALRYGFRPDSTDKTVLKLSQDSSGYIIESKDNHVFRGNATAGKDTECILLYDPSSMSFKLMPLDYILRVNPTREKLPVNKDQPSVNSNATASTTPTTSRAKTVNDKPVINGTKKTSLATNGKNSPAASAAKTAKSTPVANTKKTDKPKPAKKPASKSLPKKPSKPSQASKRVPPVKSQEQHISDDDEDDMLGALVNELEESLEDESSGSNHGSTTAAKYESEESDEDEDDSIHRNNVNIVDNSTNRHSRLSTGIHTQPTNISQGPISLRDFAPERRRDEDDLSSSEEE